MIGAAGHYLYLAGIRSDMSMNGKNNIDIEDFSIETLS
ncbi:t(6)A37 threonylcarbamoyladenosine biosynthesis protein [Streptococcus pneumoniae]|nr:t(6)A37 threonylcarbamoyladenosine biosynthesis protein [Streptococcus pneumoniae]